MIMKLMSEDRLLPYSDEFFDTSNEYNYYINNVSAYIKNTFETNDINGEAWSKYAAGYMWGVTGILYNPEEISREDASTWDIINNSKYARQITIKDNVRDSYFAAVGAVKKDLLTDEEFINSSDYQKRLAEEMNDVSEETMAKVQEYLQDVKDNVYSFETDSGKADMITGKVLANYQWSGDAVYAMDQAEEDGLYLNFAVPEESTNLWFDGWVMLKNGINGDAAKQQAAESFVNFLSRPDNAVRNMYYIGYTSVIAGNEEDDTIFEYLNWNYGAEDDEEDTIEYPVGYFFSGDNEDSDYVITAPADQAERQLFAQYPTEEVINRSAIMEYFDDEASVRINQMWINVRCYNIKDVPIWVWIIAIAIVGVMAVSGVAKHRKK
jgi:spermidine/putrescine transport system substrate-binding protein